MKTALITGASGGIGGAITKALLDNGYYVLAQYNSNEKGKTLLCEYANKVGKSDFLQFIKGDFSTDKGIEEFLQKISSVKLSIEVLINCAGVDLYKQVCDTTLNDLDKVLNINLKSAYMLSSVISKSMVEKKCGNIIFISSVLGDKGGAMETAYSMSKAGLIGLTKALSKEIAPSLVRVNCILPGAIDTPMNSIFSKEEIQDICDRTSLNRLGTPNDIANAVSFLISENASFITGQCLTVDGEFLV